MKAWNINNHKLEDFKVTVDFSGEVILKADDGSFLKYPSGMDFKEIQGQLDKYEKENKKN